MAPAASSSGAPAADDRQTHLLRVSEESQFSIDPSSVGASAGRTSSAESSWRLTAMRAARVVLCIASVAAVSFGVSHLVIHKVLHRHGFWAHGHGPSFWAPGPPPPPQVTTATHNQNTVTNKINFSLNFLAPEAHDTFRWGLAGPRPAFAMPPRMHSDSHGHLTKPMQPMMRPSPFMRGGTPPPPPHAVIVPHPRSRFAALSQAMQNKMREQRKAKNAEQWKHFAEHAKKHGHGHHGHGHHGHGHHGHGHHGHGHPALTEELGQQGQCSAGDRQKFLEMQQKQELLQDYGVCGLKCGGLDQNCLSECFQQPETGGFSKGCSLCFGHLPSCIVSSCGNTCSNVASFTDAAECYACVQSEMPRCGEEFKACTGFNGGRGAEGEEAVVTAEEAQSVAVELMALPKPEEEAVQPQPQPEEVQPEASANASASANANCNDEDKALWQENGGPKVLIEFGMCAWNCSFDVNNTQCMASCFKQRDHYSKKCSACFAAVPKCVAEQCVGADGNGPCGDLQKYAECGQCIQGKALPTCGGAFEGCTGFDLVEEGQESQ